MIEYVLVLGAYNKRRKYKMKKVFNLLLVVVMLVAFVTGCTTQNGQAGAGASTGTATGGENTASGGGLDASNIKVGVIYIGDENEGYTAAHMAGIKEMAAALGISESQIIEKRNIGEDESCYDVAVDLAEQGCNLIIANSFGHEDYILQAARGYPDVQFCHTTGYQAASAGLPNMHNAFTAVYESRYVSGVVAGLKLNEMIEKGEITADQAKMGYVGAYPFAEVVSGYTAFYLGAKSVCPSVEMVVQYTNSWSDMALEKEVASSLISDGCVLISQHADTTGAPTAAEENGVFSVGYNIDMISVAPNTALTSATINWGPYYTYAAQSVLDGTPIVTNWCQGYADGAVAISRLNENVVAAGTAEAVAKVEAAIKDGSLHVFDTSTFTIGGKTMEALIAEGGDYAKYADYVSDGYFHESEIISAPAFDLGIDGITALTN
jgi:basic membrane protein A